MTVTYSGSEGAFSWEGEVVNGDVEEVETTLVARFLTPEEAHDAAVKSAILNASVSLPAPSEWSEADLTRPGLMGSSTRGYTGSGWKVTVT